MGKDLFGTDGIRGVAGEYPLDSKTVYVAGRALARTIGGQGRVVIGMDTRESGRSIAEHLAGGLVDEGMSATFAGVLPTAAVSSLADTDAFRAGVMISASHNPFQDNGIKVFGGNGYKLPDDDEHRVEEAIFALLDGAVEPRREALTVDESLEQAYFDHLRAGVEAGSAAGLRVVVDCANGAAYHLAKPFFETLGADADIRFAEPDGHNINLDCGSLHLDELRRVVLEAKADLGVAFDGDADRALFVADDGRIVDGDVILLLAAKRLARLGRLPNNRVVTTVMANLGLEKALERNGITMLRTKVGDKYVLEEMVTRGDALGGEQSGHIIFKEFAHTGDGLLTAREMIALLREAGEPLSKLSSELTVFPQKLVNIRVHSKPQIGDVPVLADAVASAEKALDGGGRVVVRYSGTEPLVRVMIEAEKQGDVDKHCAELEAVFRRELGA